MALMIGMNSGSSFDGIDAVLFEISLGEDGQPTRPRYIDGIAYDWPPEVEALILPAFENKATIFELTRINYVAGAVYAKAALALIARTRVDPGEVLAIGVDGQTIYQEPPDRPRMAALGPDADLVERWLDGPYACGIFIGESGVIAAHTGIPTITHFRPADHAIGGTGAPLMQYLDWVSFRDIGPILTLNIGGIANCHLAAADRADMRAFDTGPGNVMLDHSMRRLYGRGYDRDGEVARTGTVRQEMIDWLWDHPFYARKPPRSAWRLDFGSAWADDMLDTWRHLPPQDVIATLTRFTPLSITKAVTELIGDISAVDTLIASGGGTRNPALMGHLRDDLAAHGIRLATSDEYGIPPQFKEAIKFGTLAFANMHLLANNIPACSGASTFTIMGKVQWPPQMVRAFPKVGERPTVPADARPSAAGAGSGRRSMAALSE
jgi:anhydro-N-acetylmuramic acid kinase